MSVQKAQSKIDCPVGMCCESNEGWNVHFSTRGHSILAQLMAGGTQRKLNFAVTSQELNLSQTPSNI